MLYTTNRPIEDDISSESEIGRIYDIYSNSGRYFAAVRGKHKKAFIIMNNKIKKVELESEKMEFDIL